MVFALFYSTVVQGDKFVLPCLKIRIVNVQKVIDVPRSRIKSLDNISLIVMVKRIHKIFFFRSSIKINQQREGRNVYPSGFQILVCKLTWFPMVYKYHPGDRIRHLCNFVFLLDLSSMVNFL